MSKVSHKKGDLKIVIKSKKSPDEIFEAIKDVAGWWIGDVDGKGDKVGAVFKFRYKTFHDTTQKVAELVPGKKVVWEVTKSSINFVKDKNEWRGTKMIFDLVPVKGGTEIHFTHEGLTPQIECFENCSAGWDFYINKSLKNFIENGEGIDPKF
jgi:hypothetical protein